MSTRTNRLYSIRFCICLSILFCFVLSDQLDKVTRLLHEAQQIEQNLKHENDALNDYIDEYDEYYEDDKQYNDIYYSEYEQYQIDADDPDPPIQFEAPSSSNDDLQSYLEAPGYTVKMNEIVFREFLAVLIDLYGMNEDHKFGDGKAAIERLRQALRDESRYFFEQPLTTIGAIIKTKWNVYKWDIAKLLAHSIPVPVVGYVLKISIAVVQYEPAVRKFIKQQLSERKVRRKYNSLNDALHVDLGEPFSLYILKHWKPLVTGDLHDEDPNCIYDMKLECPLKPKRVVAVQGSIVPTRKMLLESPGQCVWERIDRTVVEEFKIKLPFRPAQQCIAHGAEG
eukprot:340350_1